MEFAFTRGNELCNAYGLLEHKNRKQVSSIIFSSLQDVPEKEMRELIQEAIILDDIVPYKSKNSLIK